MDDQRQMNSRSDNWKSPHEGLIKKSCSRSLRRLFPGPPFCKKRDVLRIRGGRSEGVARTELPLARAGVEGVDQIHEAPERPL